jgi:predicted SnoaL-like aldol condensation-catalyzing enzyme
MRHENSLILAEGDLLMLYGRFSNVGQKADWIVADIVRMREGLWDVIQDEATQASSESGKPTFGEQFPGR